jgi:heme/copper-type cytochrome/quinol oxidase subunit 2
MGPRSRQALSVAGLLAAVVALATAVLGPNRTAFAQTPGAHTYTVVASRYAFAPDRIEVFQDDVVAIELRTDDIAHSLTIDEYRVAKRVSPGQHVTFEFRAERTGTFPFYCDLKAEDGCRQMLGVLVVRPRP